MHIPRDFVALTCCDKPGMIARGAATASTDGTSVIRAQRKDHSVRVWIRKTLMIFNLPKNLGRSAVNKQWFARTLSGSGRGITTRGVAMQFYKPSSLFTLAVNG
jgi:hypothetical protein